MYSKASRPRRRFLADNYEGKRPNALNDVVVRSDDTIWLSDPTFGINGEWEDVKAKPEQATTNVYRIARGGKLTALITDLVNVRPASRRTRRSCTWSSGRARRTAACEAMTCRPTAPASSTRMARTHSTVFVCTATATSGAARAPLSASRRSPPISAAV